MALVQVSPLVAAIQGSVSAFTFRRTPAGTVVQGWQNNLRVATSARLAARRNLALVSQIWTSTDMLAYRDGWKTLTDGVWFKDPFGTLRHPTAKNLFVAANLALISVNQPGILPAPSDFSAGSPIDVAVAVTVSPSLVINVTPSNAPTSTECASIFAMKPKKPSVKKAPNTWKHVGFGTPGDAGPYNVGPSYHNLLGEVAVGQVIFILLKYVSQVSGATGTAVQGFGVPV